nr:MAG TPA: cysteine peptidase [Caudoviricetes sp.]
MTQVYLALYKGRKQGTSPKELAQRLMDWAVRWATRGQYSHCEIAVKHSFADDYHCYSASARDGGVRSKTMPLTPDKWDLIPIRDAEAYDRVLALYQSTRGAKYDYTGALGVVVFMSIRQSARRWFCSEWCATVLGLVEPERFSPNSLAKHLSDRILGEQRMRQTLARAVLEQRKIPR